MSKIPFKTLYILFGLIALAAIFSGTNVVSATTLNTLGVTKNLAAGKLQEPYASYFPPNDITNWNPNECVDRGGTKSDSCFKINSSVGAQDFWYAEGCLNNGTCTAGVYAAGMSLVMTSTNPFLYSDTKTDDEFGGMQYIYAENYDFEYSGASTKLTPNGGNSTQKYYWIVLPDQAYSNGLGDTYVATFENLSEPVYFIVFDTHACPHQSEDYCGKASADPNGVEAGREFLGAFTKNGGGYNEVANIAGKLTSLCRINGSGEVTASQSSGNAVAASGGSSSESSTSSSLSGSDVTWIGDSYSVAAHSIIEENLPGISFGSGIENSGSYIQSNKGVSDRYGGGDSNPPALTILRRVAEAGELKPYLVMAVGTNMGWDDSEVNEFESIMSSHSGTRVVFVTAKALASLSAETDGTNERLKALTDSNDNYALADWAAVYDASYFANNSTHPDANGGYEKWVEVIVDALSSFGACTSYEGDYPEYYQWGQSWSSVPYDGGTISDSGCGPSSMAMIATAVSGTDVFPDDVVGVTSPHGNYVYTSGSGMTALDQVVGEKYGFEVIDVGYSDLNDAIQKMRQYLEDGYMLHFSGAGSPPFSSVGHYVGAFAINGDTVKVADSSKGNAEYDIHDLVYAGLHGGSFSASRGNNSGRNTCDDNYCAEDTSSNANGDVLKAVEEIIELANKNGSTYTWGGGHTDDSSVFDAMLNGAPINVDCTGFASLVMYKTYGQLAHFSSYSIFNDPRYEEVPRFEVGPGDIFAFNNPVGHGGIVIEASNGVVTKIAETGGTEGLSGGNTNIGYSGANSYSVGIMNGSSGHFFRWKGN